MSATTPPDPGRTAPRPAARGRRTSGRSTAVLAVALLAGVAAPPAPDGAAGPLTALVGARPATAAAATLAPATSAPSAATAASATTTPSAGTKASAATDASAGTSPASAATAASFTTTPSAGTTAAARTAATSTAAGVPGETRAAFLARQLRRDPVYVSPSLARVAAPGQVAALRRQVAAMPYPTFVVLAPRIDEEAGLDSFSDLPTVLRDRVDRDGLYVVSDEDGIGLEAQAFGIRTRGDVSRVSSVAYDAVPRRDGPIARLQFALRNLATAEPARRSVEAEREADDRRPWWIFGVCTALGLVLPLGVASRTRGARERRAARRRVRAARREAQPVRTPAGSREIAPRGEARRTAQEALAGLALAIAEAPRPSEDAVRRYDAASHVLSHREATALDCLGAETLTTAGRAALRGQSYSPCLFDPRHGEGARATRWRRGAEETTIPACVSCADAIARGDAPPVLLVHGDAYWDRDTVWSRTGFGALDDRVADLVLAGGRGAR